MNVVQHDGSPARTGLETYRSLRRELEDAVLPLAGSLDGRRFTFQGSLHSHQAQLGGYVRIQAGDQARLGQVTSLRTEIQPGPVVELAMDSSSPTGRVEVRFRAARGDGVILDDSEPFTDAPFERAGPADVEAWLSGVSTRGARLPVGELRLAPGVPFGLDAAGFGRHTFLCGQSGSGKTYGLGLVLERLLLETGLRIVVLDPNSDFARMAEARADADSALAARWRELASAIDVRSGDDLRLRIGELEPGLQAAILRLDPVADREEYAEFVAIVDAERPVDVQALVDSPHPSARALLQRARNLGVTRWSIWAGDRGGSVLGALAEGTARMLVVDLGSLGSREEQAVVAAGVLAQLWRRRSERRPTLVVIDEAHNVCPAVAEDAVASSGVRDAIAIAAEGRKFGLHLLVSTQRPQKIHENVLTQCENLVLMRLNAQADVSFAQSAFSFVPQELVALAASFRQGEALVAGGITSHAALMRFGARVAQEGGADVASDWARG
jgi:DNA helicase HerA-like ATPase